MIYNKLKIALDSMGLKRAYNKDGQLVTLNSTIDEMLYPNLNQLMGKNKEKWESYVDSIVLPEEKKEVETNLSDVVKPRKKRG